MHLHNQHVMPLVRVRGRATLCHIEVALALHGNLLVKSKEQVFVPGDHGMVEVAL